MVKNLPANAGDTEMQVRSLGWEGPLKEEMATQSNILAWRIPWTEEPGSLQSMGSQRVRHKQATKQTAQRFQTDTQDELIVEMSQACSAVLRARVSFTLQAFNKGGKKMVTDTSWGVCLSRSFSPVQNTNKQKAMN